ncbi:MAG TPA: hypothetical protein VH682_15885 [Gemmataceae bacterium]|jgi:MoxR-like ATPase
MSVSWQSAMIATLRWSWWWRWLKSLGWALLALLVMAICAWTWWHYSAQKRLEEALAEMDSAEPGWRLEDIEAAREQIPEEKNSARVVVAAGKLLPHPWPPNEFEDRSFGLQPSESLAADDFARLTQELAAVRPALEEARKLVNFPKGRHRIAYKSDMSTPLEDQTLTRLVSMLLTCDAHYHAQTRSPIAGLISSRAALNAARSLGDEPLGTSQVVRMACIAMGCRAIERTLGQGEQPPVELTATQKLLEDEEVFPDLLISARGQRAVTHDTYDAIESGRINVISLSTNRPPNWTERLKGRFYRTVVLNEHPTMLALMNRWVALTRLPPHEQAAAEQELEQEIRDLPKPASLTRLIFPSVTKLGGASRRKHAILRCTVVALASERYRQATRKWPESLDKLCPQFLKAVPRDPFDGEPLRYRRVEDGVVIYSVSSDGVDNNGNLDRERPNQPGVDIGCRLWDIAKRRQPPRPKPP